MKNIISTIVFVFASVISYSQCNSMGMSVAASEPHYAILSQPGFFLMSPGNSNQFDWQVSDMDGNFMYEDDTERLYVNIDLPITDSIQICLTITNPVRNEICGFCDTLAWGGSIIEWGLISSSTGELMPIISADSISLHEGMLGGPDRSSRNGAVALGDVDNDGDPDMIITGQNPSSLATTLHLNDGNGNFTEVVGTPFRQLQFGNAVFQDVDRDGDQDVLLTGSNFQPQKFAELYLNDGNGNFTLDAGTPFEPQSSGDIVFEYINGDENIDLIMSGYDANDDGHVSVYLNNGNTPGQFTHLPTPELVPVVSSSIAFINIGSTNTMDLIIAGEDNSGTKVTNLYSHDGSGNFALVTGTSFTGISAGDIAVADTDNDGDDDILINGKVGGVIDICELYINDGSDNFSLLSGTPFLASDLGTADFVDFDHDLDVDVLVTGAVTGGEFNSNIYENLGGNNFVLVDSLVDVYFSSTAIDDIDGDNDLDIVISGISNGTNGFKTRKYFNSTEVPISLDTDCFTVIHNPTEETVEIAGLLEEYTIQILDASETVFKTLESLSNSIVIDTTTLPAGLYFVHIMNEATGAVSIQTIIKE